MDKKTPSPSQLLETAKQQSRILWLVVASFPFAVMALAIPTITGPDALLLTLLVLLITGQVAISVLALFTVYRLAKALQSPAPWVYVGSAIIPYISMLTLLIINYRATAALKRAGIRVGLMGANRADLLQIQTTPLQPPPAKTA